MEKKVDEENYVEEDRYAASWKCRKMIKSLIVSSWSFHLAKPKQRRRLVVIAYPMKALNKPHVRASMVAIQGSLLRKPTWSFLWQRNYSSFPWWKMSFQFEVSHSERFEDSSIRCSRCDWSFLRWSQFAYQSFKASRVSIDQRNEIFRPCWLAQNNIKNPRHIYSLRQGLSIIPCPPKFKVSIPTRVIPSRTHVVLTLYTL